MTNLVDTAVALCPDIRCEGNVTPAVRQVLSRYEHLRGASDAVIEREVQLRSPILRVSQIALQHLWIIAAEQDQIISLDIVQRYVQTLTENRISHTFTTIPGADHLFYYYWRNFEPVPGSQRTLWWQVLQYFQTHLKR